MSGKLPSFPTVRCERRGAVALVTLDRPDKLNAIDARLREHLHRALDACETEEAVRALVVAGAGRAFSAGFDLEPRTVPGLAALRAELRADYELIMRFWDSPKPTVAAAHGYCLGGAMELAMACDLTIAAEGCRFGVPEVRFGSGSVVLLLPWLVGPKQAKELLLTGEDRVSAARMFAAGLVNRVVADGAHIEAALDLARSIAANDPVAVALTKQAINRSLEVAGLRRALEQAFELDVLIEATETPESKEFNDILGRDGVRAALAWRAARADAGREQT